ncbi:MAG: hypothetical protein QNK37_32785 [Acidobacteriota bacterium]|nr:hypothetical protein [Acidobacteriota bacterium]
MSIFPKKARRGDRVTIHHAMLAQKVKEFVFPYVRLGVKDPAGDWTPLFEGHLMKMPKVSPTVSEPGASGNLRRSLPIHVLAGYLSTGSKRQQLTEILEGIPDAVHRYFVYEVPADARPGRYEVISELYVNGRKRLSGTRDEDFFFVEELTVNSVESHGDGWRVRVTNLSQEPVQVALAAYGQDDFQMRIHTIPGDVETSLAYDQAETFLVWSEGRVVQPLFDRSEPLCLRNQRYTVFRDKEDADAVFIMDAETEDGFRLEGRARSLMLAADGKTTRSRLRTGETEEIYDELVANGLIVEIDVDDFVPVLQSKG